MREEKAGGCGQRSDGGRSPGPRRKLELHSEQGEWEPLEDLEVKRDTIWCDMVGAEAAAAVAPELPKMDWQDQPGWNESQSPLLKAVPIYPFYLEEASNVLLKDWEGRGVGRFWEAKATFGFICCWGGRKREQLQRADNNRRGCCPPLGP